MKFGLMANARSRARERPATGSPHYGARKKRSVKMSNTELIRSYYTALWCDQNVNAIYEFLDREVVITGLALEPMDRERFRVYYERMRELVPDVRIDVTHAIEQDEWICMRGFASGNHLASGNPVTVWGGGFVRLDSGRISETHETWDLLSMMVQIGRVPRRVADDLLPKP
jgi:hypothetical protein